MKHPHSREDLRILSTMRALFFIHAVPMANHLDQRKMSSSFGCNIGEMRMLVQLVRDGDLKIERAAEKAKMTMEQFKKMMENTPLGRSL